MTAEQDPKYAAALEAVSKAVAERVELLRVDSRKRVTLGALAKHEYYSVTVNEYGHITLIPTWVIADDHPIAETIRNAIDHPETLVERDRPGRKPD